VPHATFGYGAALIIAPCLLEAHINHQIARCDEDCATLTAAINAPTHTKGRVVGGPRKHLDGIFRDLLRMQRRINDRGESRVSHQIARLR
jgi:hypothetical protein